MKERLHDLGIKTTELSSYMKISRPSLYKYINMYEEKDYGGIPPGVLRTFKYIDKYKTVTKEQIISFVILEFSDSEGSDKKEVIRNYLLAKGPNDPKIVLMYNLIVNRSLDDLVGYLSNASQILNEPRLNDSQLYQVARLVILRDELLKNIPLTEEELSKAKEMIGECYVREE